MHVDDRVPDRSTRWWILAATALTLVVGLPLLLAGPGNDLDVANVFRSGRSIVLHGDYVPSRAPGAPIHETAVGLLDRLLGPRGPNLVSLASAAVLVFALDRLLAHEGLGSGRRWAIAVIVTNPWFLIAATSTVDFIPALALVTVAALALRRGHPVWAGIAAGAAIGCRIGSALLIAALLLAELTDRGDPAGPDDLLRSTDPDPDPDPDTDTDTDGADQERGDPAVTRSRLGLRWRPVLVTGLVTTVTTLVLFVPSFLHAGGLEFAENDFRTAGLLVHVGRTAVKDLLVLGPIASIAALLAVPAVLTALRGWSESWLIRFAVPSLVLSQLLFVRFPWKMGHLLPSLLAGTVLLAVALARRPRLLIVLVALQLLHGIVTVDLVEPNRPNEATGGRVTLDLGPGPVLRDLRCRHDHPRPQRGRQRIEVEAAWNCAQAFDR